MSILRSPGPHAPLRWKPMLGLGGIVALGAVLLILVAAALYPSAARPANAWFRLGQATGQFAGLAFIAGVAGSYLRQRARPRLGLVLALLGPAGALGFAIALAVHAGT